MRLWHYKLIPFLPNSQLIAQWRELNSIFKKQDKHILINYVYEYDKEDLLYYSKLVLDEMKNRGFKNIKLDNYVKYFNDFLEIEHNTNGYHIKVHVGVLFLTGEIFLNHHTNRYLLQCFIIYKKNTIEDKKTSQKNNTKN